MIHRYKNNGYNIVLDVNSGSVHVVDELVYRILPFVEDLVKEGRKDAGAVKEAVLDRIHSAWAGEEPVNAADEEISEAVEEILELEAEGLLFAPDIYENYVYDFKKRRTVVKALCLHIAHDCNLACDSLQVLFCGGGRIPWQARSDEL